MHARYLYELLDLSICTESGEITVKRFEFEIRVVIDVVGQRKKATRAADEDSSANADQSRTAGPGTENTTEGS